MKESICKSTLLLVAAALLASATEGATRQLAGRQTDAVLELKSGNTYVVSAEYIIPKDCTLKIPEDVSMVFDQNIALAVEGTLIVIGSMQKPVRFLGKQSRPGFWSGIQMKNGSKADLYGAVVSDAKCGWRSAWGSSAVAKSCAFINNSKGVCFWENNGTLNGCYVAKNEGIGVHVHYGPSIISHCTITENEGCGIGGWGSARLTACVVTKNLSHGIGCSNGKSFATGCIIENNREYDVKNDTNEVWDFGENYWGEASTRMLKAKGVTANLLKVNDKLDGNKEGIVDLTGFLVKPPKDCGAHEYPGGRFKGTSTSANLSAGDDADEDSKSDAAPKAEDDEAVETPDAENEEENEEKPIEKVVARTAKVSVPTKAAIEKSMKVVNELCTGDYKTWRNGKMSSLAFAKKLLAYAKMTEDNAVKFVLYQNAFLQLVIGGELSKAQDMFEQIMAKCGARYASAMAEKATKAIEKKMRNYNTAKAANKLYARTTEIRQCVQAIVDADAGLLSAPSNKTFKQQKASNCVKIGDWPLALSVYAEETDSKRGEIARWERADPETRSKKFTAESVGDYWWEQIDGKEEEGLFYESVSRHAAYWYQKAVDEGGMSELKVLLIKKRIASVIGDKAASSLKKESHAARPRETAQEKSDAAKTASTAPVVLIPTAESGGTSCRFTQQKPMSVSWMSRLFDDSSWGTCRTEINESVWRESDIWVRSYFDCDVDPKKIKKLVLRYRIDDDIEVWLNGKLVYQHNGAHGDYWNIALEINGNQIKRKNVLCVHAHQLTGPMYVDFGLTAILSNAQ